MGTPALGYLPNVQPKDNNTQQIRRRTNAIVSVVSQQVGSIASGTGDLGTLSTTKADAANPSLSGTVSLSGATVAASATAGSATALPAQPVGYLTQVINGQTVKIPYYAV